MNKMNINVNTATPWSSYDFRFWKLFEKGMAFPSYIKFQPPEEIWVNDGNYLGKVGEDCILMHCTGLRDKHGVLVYEGDILANTETYKRVDYKANIEVFFDCNIAEFVLEASYITRGNTLRTQKYSASDIPNFEVISPNDCAIRKAIL